MAQSAWQPTAEATARMQSQLYYLSHRAEPISLSEASPWAHNPEVEWPIMDRAGISREYAAEVKQILAEGLRDFEEVPGGPPQWNFTHQDCYHGREQVARAEGNLADVSCLWVCEDDLEIVLTILEDFFPQGPRASVPVANDEGQRRQVPYFGALRWRKFARAVAGAESVHPGGSWSFPPSMRWPKIWRPSASL
eukprot:4396238-Amphidinium_carterae.1